MSFMKNVQASLKSLADNGIINIAGAGVPTNGTAGTGVNVTGPGSFYFDKTNGKLYQNSGTEVSPTWSLIANSTATGVITPTMLEESVLQIVDVTLTPANIIAMFGAPVSLVAAPGATKVIRFLRATLIYDFGVAAYTGGGDVTIGYTGAAIMSTTIAAANSFASAGDKIFSFSALNAAGGYTMPVNTGLSITNAVGAFVNPGTATGVGRLKIVYRVITHGL